MKTSFNQQYIFSNSVILFFQLLGVFLAISCFNKLTKSKFFLEDLLNNWQSKPFTSFKLFNEDCPKKNNFDNFKLNKYYLKCNNGDATNNLNMSYKNNLSLYKELYESNKLLDTLNYTVCGEKMKSFDYLNYLNQTYSGEKNCQKNCGMLDSLNNNLCVGGDETCPLNNFKFVKKGEKNESQASTTSMIDINSDYFFQISNEEGDMNKDSKIILAFDLVEDSFNVTNSCSEKGNKEDVLMNTSAFNRKSKTFLKNKDDSNNFNVRKIGGVETNSKKEYTHIKGKVEHVNTINFIGWKKDCFLNSTKSPDKVAIYINEYNTVYDNSDGLLFRFSIFTIIVIFILFIYAPFKMMTDTTPYFYVLAFNTLFMIISVNKIMSNISIAWKVLYGSARDSFPVEQCSDDYTNFKLAELKQSFSSVLYYDTFLFFSQFINWTIPLYVLVVMYIKRDEEEEREGKDSLK